MLFPHPSPESFSERVTREYAWLLVIPLSLFDNRETNTNFIMFGLDTTPFQTASILIHRASRIVLVAPAAKRSKRSTNVPDDGRVGGEKESVHGAARLVLCRGVELCSSVITIRVVEVAEVEHEPAVADHRHAARSKERVSAWREHEQG